MVDALDIVKDVVAATEEHDEGPAPVSIATDSKDLTLVKNLDKSPSTGDSPTVHESNHKTCICTFWIHGMCKNGADQCRFAHGEDELKLPMSKTVTRRKNRRLNRQAKLNAMKNEYGDTDYLAANIDEAARQRRNRRQAGGEDPDCYSDDLEAFLMARAHKRGATSGFGSIDTEHSQLHLLSPDGFIPEHLVSLYDDKPPPEQEVDLTQIFLAVVLLARKAAAMDSGGIGQNKFGVRESIVSVGGALHGCNSFFAVAQ